MMDVETIVLENGQEYIIFNRKNINNNLYVYLVNLNDSNDFVIRKVLNNMLVGLEDETEFNIALQQLVG